MALYSKTITGLINGVSRQPFQMRLESQGQEQINCVSSVSKGVTRRPGLKQLKHYAPPSAPGITDHWHWIDRSLTERYLVHVEENDTDIRVIDLLTGSVASPSGADSYINADDGDLRFLTIGDVTYILNTTKVPAMDTTRSTNPKAFAYVWVKAAIASCDYKIQLKRTGSSAVELSWTSPAAGTSASTTATVTTAIAAEADPGTFTVSAAASSLLLVEVDSVSVAVNDITYTASTKRIARAAGSWITEGVSVGINVVVTGSVSNNGTYTVTDVDSGGAHFTVRETVADETDAAGSNFAFNPDFTISTSDGWGDQALVAVKTKSRVQAFSSLPPTGINGMILEVEGDPETSVDSYYVKFVASGTGAKTVSVNGTTTDVGIGVWEETVKWDTVTSISATNMPRKLTWNGSTWVISSVTWASREVGDTDTAPDPSFIGSEITALAFFKNRLALVSGESVVFSGVSEYESFFPTTVTTLTDDDAFDVTANFPDVAKLQHAVPLNDVLVLFAESGIFGVRGSRDVGFTPSSVEFLRLAGLTGTLACPPVLAGDRIFFGEVSNERLIVREFFPIDSEGTYAVESISEHVGDYINPEATTMPSLTVDATNGMLALLSPAGNPQAWVYQWFMSNREKVQSAWHSWSFTGLKTPNLLSSYFTTCQFIRGNFYLVSFQISGTTWEIGYVPSDPDVLSGADKLGTVSDTNHCIPYLDWYQVVTGASTGGNTTFDVEGSLTNWDLASPATEAIVALGYGAAWGASTGSAITGWTHTADTPSAGYTRLTFTGTTYVGRTLLIGVRYYSRYDFNPPLQKSQSNTPVLSGRAFARRWRARFTEPVTVTGHRTVGPAATFATTRARTLDFTQRRVAEFPVHREVGETLQTGIYSSHETQGFELFGVEWEYEWQPRARPT